MVLGSESRQTLSHATTSNSSEDARYSRVILCIERIVKFSALKHCVIWSRFAIRGVSSVTIGSPAFGPIGLAIR